MIDCVRICGPHTLSTYSSRSRFSVKSMSEAIALLRGLVTEVRLTPETTPLNGHIIELTGDLAAILALSEPKRQKTRRLTGGVSVCLVAGVGFELCRTLVRTGKE